MYTNDMNKKQIQKIIQYMICVVFLLALVMVSGCGKETVDDGMTYCAGDKEFYVDMLKEYIDSYEEKSQQLNKLFRTKEWSQYQIYVHALKSTSRTIGANDLSELARSMEEASSKGDGEYIGKYHDKLMTDYKVITEGIAQALKQ